MMLEYSKVSKNPFIEDLLEQLKEIQAKLSDHLFHAQAKYKKVANKHRLDSTLEDPKLKLVIGYGYYVVM